MTTTDQPLDDSSGSRMSNETRAYTLLVETLENSNRTQTTSDRWIISVLSIIACITAISLYLDLSKSGYLGENKPVVNQTVNQSVSHPTTFDDLVNQRKKEAR